MMDLMDREVIIPLGMESAYEKGHYAPAFRVGDTIYVSGQIGRDAQMSIVEDAEAQIAQAFDNVASVLKAAGVGMEDIVDLTSFHTDMRQLGLFMQVKDRYMARDFPAWTAVGVVSVGGISELIVEIKVVAVRRRKN